MQRKVTVAEIYLYAGVLLLGSSAALHYFLYLRLRDAGHNYIVFDWFWPVLTDYLRLRSKNDWSPWPVFLAALMIVAGFALFCIGVFEL